VKGPPNAATTLAAAGEWKAAPAQEGTGGRGRVWFRPSPETPQPRWMGSRLAERCVGDTRASSTAERDSAHPAPQLQPLPPQRLAFLPLPSPPPSCTARPSRTRERRAHALDYVSSEVGPKVLHQRGWRGRGRRRGRGRVAGRQVLRRGPGAPRARARAAGRPCKTRGAPCHPARWGSARASRAVQGRRAGLRPPQTRPRRRGGAPRGRTRRVGAKVLHQRAREAGPKRRHQLGGKARPKLAHQVACVWIDGGGRDEMGGGGRR
jgi:hypothetical protein